MALNRYMHPRNIYRCPPDFAKLAKSYSEFASISKVDVTGKVIIDFKDPHSLRVLTKCLLKSDFNLDVDIPDDRLVPTLPLRLNYILWIEDILNLLERKGCLWGLDIGTGACAIYPLLAATQYKWHMVGTETDNESLQKAQDNIHKNSLQDLITLKKNPTSSVIEHIFCEGYDQIFDFSMCNPPFYSSIQELCESRSPARLPPKNGFTGSPHELITEGGELEFCRKYINESKNHKDKVLVYTTMVGHKYNLKELRQYLKAEGINNTHTEFCQGRVTRWGLAWTYQNYNIHSLVPPRDQPRKKNLPIIYLLPEIPNIPYDVENMLSKLKSILNDLQIIHKIIHKRGSNITYDIMASSNTWANQRRKRRLMRRLEADGDKKMKSNNEEVITFSNSHNPIDITKSVDVLDSTTITKVDMNTEVIESEKTSTVNNNLASSSSNEDILQPVVHATLKLFKKENNILMEMEHLDGSAGKQGLHQIVQYIKNNWK